MSTPAPPWRRIAIAAAACLALAAATVVFFSLAPQMPFLPTTTAPPLVELTLLSETDTRGALCLDGSPPGYHLQRGVGSGSDSWILHLQGGGWCHSIKDCSARKMTEFGSSHYMEAVEFVGIFSSESLQNPDFYNWNKVVVRYCDGASFAGDVEIKNGTALYFRGLHILEAVLDEVFKKGLANAKRVLVTGCSAGGLATYIHCDRVHAHFPDEVDVKCLADGGFFLDVLDLSAERSARSFYNDVINLQNVMKQLPESCISKMEPAKCMFPAEIVKTIRTPLFILNSAYDSWQIPNMLAPDRVDPKGLWKRCKRNIHQCDAAQIAILQGFRKAFIDALKVFEGMKDLGIFADSCFAHCQTTASEEWHSPTSPRISNKTIAEAVGDWYFNRTGSDMRHIDGEYPCNPTCLSN